MTRIWYGQGACRASNDEQGRNNRAKPLIFSLLIVAAVSIAQAAGGAPLGPPATSANDGRDSPAREIIVWGREPETERYRIPPGLRQSRSRPPEQSWSSRAQANHLGRASACSPVGPGAAFGCLMEDLRPSSDLLR